jgi:hypothetical protein
MKRLPLLLFVTVLTQAAFTCETTCIEEPAPAATTPATICDLTGLDGCGYVLQLDNGKRLEPAGKAWEAYTKHDGEKVMVSYTVESRGSICMSGQTVKLTTIEQANGRCGTTSAGSN